MIFQGSETKISKESSNTAYYYSLCRLLCVCKTKKRKSRKETILGKANCHYQKFKTNKEMKGMEKRGK